MTSDHRGRSRRPAHWRVPPLLVALVALAAAVTTACSSAAWGGTGSTQPAEQPTMARNLADAEGAFRDVVDELATDGLDPLTGTAEFAPCGAGSTVAFAPTLVGQLRSRDGRDPAAADGAELRDRLVADGWGVQQEQASTVTDTAESEIALFGYRSADLALRVVLQRDATVEVVLTGACLPATADEGRFYEAMGTWYLNALVPVTTEV